MEALDLIQVDEFDVVVAEDTFGWRVLAEVLPEGPTLLLPNARIGEDRQPRERSALLRMEMSAPRQLI